jgi:predicted nucleic acid-binding protein
MIYLDTGFFIALFNPGDHLHARAVGWANAIDEPMLLTEYVLWESVNYFSGRADRPKAHALVEHIRTEPSYELVYATPRLLAAGLSLHKQRSDKDWSLTDCIGFRLMEERGIKRALAYDRHFVQAGFTALLRFDPPR